MLTLPAVYSSPLGTVRLDLFDLATHLESFHHWVTAPHARYWHMQDYTLERLMDEYATLLRGGDTTVAWGTVAGHACFLAEYYQPAPLLRGLAALEPGDLGMHILTAPPTSTPRRNLTSTVFAAAVATAFRDPDVRRVVVEPDARNDKVRAKNVAAGFIEHAEIKLAHKVAMFSCCTREAFEGSALRARAQIKELS